MSRTRLILCIVLSALAAIWSLGALYAHMVRLQHKEVVTAIRDGEALPDMQQLSGPIAAYHSANHLLPCTLALHEDLGLLLARKTDLALDGADLDQSAQTLDEMRHALIARLSCAPQDGKAWLDLATIDSVREGFTKRALQSFAMSARVAPGESWLAEKRLLFALQFRPLLDAQARTIAASDIAVLRRAHPNRITHVMEMAGVDSPEALHHLLETPQS